jgi:uncharacterized protein YjiS (DUF1127 family)
MSARIGLPARAAPVAGFLRRFAETVDAWAQRARDRRDLAELDERQRRDMGLDLDAIRRETNKPFWRA